MGRTLAILIALCASFSACASRNSVTKDELRTMYQEVSSSLVGTRWKLHCWIDNDLPWKVKSTEKLLLKGQYQKNCEAVK